MLRQNLPPKPKFTEKDIPDLTSKVYIISGSNTGVGKELARLLYSANATVYMACRTESKAQKAIEGIRAAAPTSEGRLEYLHLDLGDLRTIKPAVEAFTAKEDKLHVLFNNAGVMVPPEDQKTAQGYDLQLGTNCVGLFLFTQLLTPTLARTAESEPAGTVRVVWVSSMAAELYSVKYGVDMSNLRGKNFIKEPNVLEKYGISKAGNYLHSVEFARRHKEDGIVSVVSDSACTLGCEKAVAVGRQLTRFRLDSDLYRSVNEQSGFQKISLSMFTKFMLYPVINGAYSELFAGLSPEVTMEKTGSWIGPFGRFFNIRKDIAVNAKPVSEGGKGFAEEFWDWSTEQVNEYL